MKTSWPTVALVAVVVAGLVALVALRVSPEVIAAIGGLGTVLAAAFEKMFRRPALVLLCCMGLGATVTACSSWGTAKRDSCAAIRIANEACTLLAVQRDAGHD